MGTRTVICVVGARPNFMKIAPVLRVLDGTAGLRTTLVHTGQHYGDMSDSFFEELEIRRPEVNLEVGSASHAVQTAEIMRRFEPVIDAAPADAVLVVGDVNSTIACALVAAKKQVPVVHVEAGLRSFDRSMPEEINRVLTDQLSDLLYTTEEDAQANLSREGIDAARVHFVGNVMIDTLMRSLAKAVPAAETMAEEMDAGRAASVAASGYALLTLHRPANVDDPAVLGPLMQAVAEASRRVPVVFPVHPRTAGAIRQTGLDGALAGADVTLMPPVSYLKLVGLLRQAKVVLTDSGGLQEESTALGIPCFTLRPNTERPITVTQGTNTVIGNRPEALLAAMAAFAAGDSKSGRVPPLWDGRAAQRIAVHLAGWFDARFGD